MTFALTVGALRIGEATGPRLTISAGTLTLAVLKAPQTGFADQRRWLALSGSMTAALEGVGARHRDGHGREPGDQHRRAGLDDARRRRHRAHREGDAARRARSPRRSARVGTLAGSFTYERQGTTTVLGLAGATVTRRQRTDPTVTDGTGVLVLQSTGVAGFLSGKAAVVAERHPDRRPRPLPRQHDRRRGRQDRQRRRQRRRPSTSASPRATRSRSRSPTSSSTSAASSRSAAPARSRRRRSRTARPSRRSPAPA